MLVDFTTINTTVSTNLAADRRCSLCSGEMGYWVAFLGGPRAAELMHYTDPPGCVDLISTVWAGRDVLLGSVYDAARPVPMWSHMLLIALIDHLRACA